MPTKLTDRQRNRALWVLAHYGRPEYWLKRDGAHVQLSLFIPDIDGEPNPDAEFVGRLFDAIDKDDKRDPKRPNGSTSRGALKEVPGSWCSAWRLGGCTNIAKTVITASGLYLADEALWKSWRALLDTSPRRSPDFDPEIRAELVKEFGRMLNRKEYKRELYPAEELVNTQVALHRDPLDKTHRLVKVERINPTSLQRSKQTLTAARKAAASATKRAELAEGLSELRATAMLNLEKEVNARDGIIAQMGDELRRVRKLKRLPEDVLPDEANFYDPTIGIEF